MSESLAARIMARLRDTADRQARPKERNGTLDRLVEACNDIADGKARAIIKEGLPEAEVNYRRPLVLIKPPRVEEYVLARRALDVRARRIPSPWTGPTATTIRKDAGLLEYVRVREQEQAAVVPGKVKQSVDQTLDRIEDMALRTELRFLLSHARQAEHDLRRLKEGMRKLRPTIDVESLISGRGTGKMPELEQSGIGALPVHHKSGGDNLAHAFTAVLKLTNQRLLSKCGLEFSEEFGNVVERKTRFELITADELAALRAITGHHNA